MLVTPPAGEPLALEDVKAWARIDGSDDDKLLWNLVSAARTAAEEFLRRSLLSQTWKLTLDLANGSGGGPWWDGVREGAIGELYGELPRTIPLPKGPVTAISSVATYNSANVSSIFDPSNYRTDSSGDRLILNSGAIWPSAIRPLAGCEITYVAGYGSTSSHIPQPIRTGMLIHVASLYEQRGMCEDAMALPAGSKQLYGPYRVVGDRRG